jgi:hypothetical protein
MTIFNVVNQVAQPTVEILLISPFKEIWERDVSPSKFYALNEFTYIEFMCSPKKTNPFYGYINLEERSTKIKERLYNRENVHKSIADTWKPDSEVREAIEIYRSFLKSASPALDLLESCYKAAEGIRDFLNMDGILTRVNSKGFPLYKVGDVMGALSKMEGIVKSLNSLREKVEQELYESTKSRGNRRINKFEE